VNGGHLADAFGCLPRRTDPLVALLVVVVAATSAVALVAGKAGAATTTSPRGTIALTGAADTTQAQVYVFHLATRKLSRLTSGSGDHSAVGWSPDGSRLLVAERGRDRRGLYSMRADGSSKVRLVKRWGGEASWSPDGRRVAYLAPGGTSRRLYVVDVNGRHRRLLTDDVGVSPTVFFNSGDFSWAPNGRRIVFGRPNGLFTITTTGKPVTHQIELNAPARPKRGSRPGHPMARE